MRKFIHVEHVKLMRLVIFLEQRVHPVGRALPPDDAARRRLSFCIRLG